MSLTKFINIFVSRLPPHPSIEIALTKLYRLYVEADDLFFFLDGKLFPRSWELHCSLPPPTPRPPGWNKSSRIYFWTLRQNLNYETLSNTPGSEQAILHSFKNLNANALISL